MKNKYPARNPNRRIVTHDDHKNVPVMAYKKGTKEKIKDFENIKSCAIFFGEPREFIWSMVYRRKRKLINKDNGGGRRGRVLKIAGVEVYLRDH